MKLKVSDEVDRAIELFSQSEVQALEVVNK